LFDYSETYPETIHFAIAHRKHSRRDVSRLIESVISDIEKLDVAI